jgi:hypothetical protein
LLAFGEESITFLLGKGRWFGLESKTISVWQVDAKGGGEIRGSLGGGGGDIRHHPGGSQADRES